MKGRLPGVTVLTMNTLSIINNYKKGLLTYNEATKLSQLDVDLTVNNDIVKPAELFTEIASGVDDVTLAVVSDYKEGYLPDLITEAADDLTPIYYNDIIDLLRDTDVADYFKEALEIATDTDVYKVIQVAYILKLENDCNANLLDLYRLIVLKQFNHQVTTQLLEAIVDEVLELKDLEDIISVAKWYAEVYELRLELLDDYVKDWVKYTEYDYIIEWLKSDTLTFMDCLYSLKHADFYKDVVDNSIAREVIFSELAKRLDVTYNDIYNQWC